MDVDRRMNQAAKGKYVSGKLLMCLCGARMLSRQAGARFQYGIEESREGPSGQQTNWRRGSDERRLHLSQRSVKRNFARANRGGSLSDQYFVLCQLACVQYTMRLYQAIKTA